MPKVCQKKIINFQPFIKKVDSPDGGPNKDRSLKIQSKRSLHFRYLECPYQNLVDEGAQHTPGGVEGCGSKELRGLFARRTKVRENFACQLWLE